MEEFNNADQIKDPGRKGTLKARFAALHPDTKRKAATGVIIAGLMSLFVVGYYLKRQEQVEESAEAPVEEVRMDRNILEKSLYAKTEKLLVAQKKETEELKKAIKAIRYTLEQNPQIVQVPVPEKEVAKEPTPK
jgi:hypothetical protein